MEIADETDTNNFENVAKYLNKDLQNNAIKDLDSFYADYLSNKSYPHDADDDSYPPVDIDFNYCFKLTVLFYYSHFVKKDENKKTYTINSDEYNGKKYNLLEFQNNLKLFKDFFNKYDHELNNVNYHYAALNDQDISRNLSDWEKKLKK